MAEHITVNQHISRHGACDEEQDGKRHWVRSRADERERVSRQVSKSRGRDGDANWTTGIRSRKGRQRRANYRGDWDTEPKGAAGTARERAGWTGGFRQGGSRLGLGGRSHLLSVKRFGGEKAVRKVEPKEGSEAGLKVGPEAGQKDKLKAGVKAGSKTGQKAGSKTGRKARRKSREKRGQKNGIRIVLIAEYQKYL